jgi:hypothetical protein
MVASPRSIAIVCFLLIELLSTCSSSAQVSRCPNSKFGHEAVTREDVVAAVDKHKEWLRDIVKLDSNHQLASAFNIRVAVSERNVKGRAVFCNRDMSGLDLRSLELSGADLRGANLSNALLSSSHLFHAYLSDACLYKADLSSADLSESIADGALFRETNLTNAKLSGASLEHSAIQGAIVTGARLDDSRLLNTIYSPNSEPPNPYVGTPYDLRTVRFWVSIWDNPGSDCGEIRAGGEPRGLVQLRKIFSDAGETDFEREATFAIERGKTTSQLSNFSFDFSYIDFSSRFRTAIRNICWQLFGNKDWASGLEGLLRTVFFEWTSGYGLYPGRPLLLLAIITVIMSAVYWIPISFQGNWLGAIYRIWPKDRIGFTPKGVSFLEPKIERVHAPPLKGVWYALQFSVLSSFQIGWKEYSIGTWLSRIQSQEYYFSPKGLIRTVSGVQSVAAVYLLALAILTYFGRPFAQ